jgi:preprotein translocase YajC subunit
MFTVDSFLMQAIPLISVFMVFYVIVIRPGRMSERRRWASVKALEGGEKIRLASGMKATFIQLHGDPDYGEYEVEIAEGLRVRVFETGIVKVLPLRNPMEDSSSPEVE